MRAKVCPVCKRGLPISGYSKFRKKSDNGKYYTCIRYMCKQCRSYTGYITSKRNNPYIPKKKQAKQCLECGKTFLANRTDTKYCSPMCSYHKQIRPKARKWYIVCDICNKEFYDYFSRKYCSDECRKEGKRRTGRIQAKEYRENHPEYSALNLARIKQWKLDNPTRDKEVHKISKRRRRARRLNAEGKHTLEDIATLKMWQGNKCLNPNCNKPITAKNNLTVDHIVPLVDGGTDSVDNLQLLCRFCNSSKNVKTIDYRVYNPFEPHLQ